MSTLVFAGDVIKTSGASAATRFVYVGGVVVSRGEKEFRDGITLTQAILSAGAPCPAAKRASESLAEMAIVFSGRMNTTFN